MRPSSPRLVIENALDRMAADLHEGAFPTVDFETARSLVSDGPEHEFRSAPPLRGVVTTACYIARTFGVRSAMPMFKALELCPGAVVLPPDMAKYKRVSEAIRARSFSMRRL